MASAGECCMSNTGHTRYRKQYINYSFLSDALKTNATQWIQLSTHVTRARNHAILIDDGGVGLVKPAISTIIQES